MMAGAKWRGIAAAFGCLAAGVALSHCVERGVRVEAVTVGATPALRFLPTDSNPHPVALLAHGLSASKETLFRLGEALAAAGFECFAVDLPGHGRSPLAFALPRSSRMDANARTLEGVARAIRPDIFAGHSMGSGSGAAAVRNAGLNPRLFIAIGSLPALGDQAPPLLLLEGTFDEAIASPARASGRWSLPLSEEQLRPNVSQRETTQPQHLMAVIAKFAEPAEPQPNSGQFKPQRRDERRVDQRTRISAVTNTSQKRRRAHALHTLCALRMLFGRAAPVGFRRSVGMLTTALLSDGQQNGILRYSRLKILKICATGWFDWRGEGD